MTPPPTVKPPLLNPAPAAERTLRRLFLTLFLRGRSSRGLKKEGAPRSVGEKLALVLLFYGAFGCFALMFLNQPVFALSIYLHGMTFVFLGMFVASSAGEILFNKEEADILLHRPVTSRALLWAKIAVLVEVSLWLAGAFNFAGFFAGACGSQGGWGFVLPHAISTAMEALFCTGSVVLAYQLCLRWFGREKLEGLMTSVQVLVSVGAVLAGQIVPRVMMHFEKGTLVMVHSWWVGLLPPAWFAGFDDAIAGSGAGSSWRLAGLGVVMTALVLWLAFGKLSGEYESGLQKMGQTISPQRPAGRARRRWLDALVEAPPLSWWLRDSVSRASFLLTAAYLMRDRDVKLRVYPGIAPVLIMPVVFLMQDSGRHQDSFGLVFGSAYIGLIPLMALGMLRYSQQWQAADIFRAAPLPGPAQLSHGARRAVLCFLTAPALALLGIFAWMTCGNPSQLLMLLPGLIALPVFALIPGLGSGAVPLSQPTEEAKSAGRGLSMFGAMMVSFAITGLAVWAKSGGWFWYMILVEFNLAVVLYIAIRAKINSARWQSLE